MILNFLTTLSVILSLVVLVALPSASNARLVADNALYSIWRVPDTDDAQQDVVRPVDPLTAGVALIGGGTDCDAAFEFMISNANQGDFVVLRASSSDGYNDYVYELSQSMNKTLHSVTTVLFKKREAAFDEVPLSFLKGAEAVFFAGGDQGLYLQLWADSPVQAVAQSKIDSGVTIGGTSAGLAIMGTRIYTATEDSAFSDESLENPYSLYITFGTQFLKIPNFQNVVTDTHFGARDRMGRMLTFVARTQVDYNQPEYRGLGVDEQTALLFDVNSGVGKTVGVGNGYICGSPSLPAVCVHDKPWKSDDIRCHRVSSKAGDTYDFVHSKGSGVDYTLAVDNGKIYGLPYGP